jgi:putative membrane protein
MPLTRRIALVLGGLALAAAWLGPLPLMARHAFAAHMALHMTVVALAAPLLALGVAGGRCDPVRIAPALFPPIPLSMLELIVVWAWHAPALHGAARERPAAFAAEQAMFLLAGVLVWLSALGGGDGGGQARRAAGVVALLLTSMHMALLGALLALTPRPLYHQHGKFPAALDDQHLGGALMLLAGGLVYLAGGLGLTRRVLAGAVDGVERA